MSKVFEADILNQKQLNEVLGSFYKATGLQTEAVNNQGESFFVPDNLERSEFCNLVRCSVEGEEKCRESYRRATLEANKWEEPYFFRCHAGLVTWVVPIKLKEMSFGSIICGKILMWEPDEFFWLELKNLNAVKVDFTKLKEAAKKLEVIAPERTQAAADMLFVVVNHLIKRDVHSLEQNEVARKRQQEIRSELELRRNNSETEFDQYDNYLKKERKLLRYIRLGDKIRAENTLQSILTDLYTKTVGDISTTKVRILELATLVSRAAVEGGANAKRTMGMLDEFNTEVKGHDKIEEYFYKIYQIVEKFLENIFALADKKHLSLVMEARNYIMKNYASPIKIQDVAKKLYISPSHLSRLFRQELDCTVNDYLTRVRVEKAVELMKRPELNVERVSKAVGFSNQSYFARVFRKYIGVNPLVYRNSIF